MGCQKQLLQCYLFSIILQMFGVGIFIPVFEFIKNQTIGIGEDAKTLDNVWLEAELFFNDKELQELHLKKSQKVDIDGVQQASEIILSSK